MFVMNFHHDGGKASPSTELQMHTNSKISLIRQRTLQQYQIRDVDVRESVVLEFFELDRVLHIEFKVDIR